MTTDFVALLKAHDKSVQAVLNLLMESPYFYRTDDEPRFLFLRRHQKTFAEFFEQCYGWSLHLDDKCARVYKPRWYNTAISESNRDLFRLSKRDECIAFLLLLEFFEHQLDEYGMTVEERDHLRFRFGDLLQHSHRRFNELQPEREPYSEEHVRQLWRTLMPRLEQYRFLAEEPKPADTPVASDDQIYIALPALYHYDAGALMKGLAPGAATADLQPAGDDLPPPTTGEATP